MSSADPSWRQLRVLVVDDVDAMRLINTALLGQLGVSQVREAADGRSALALLERERFDLVLSDWRMPGMDGLELLQALRSQEAFRTLPFVLISAETDPKLLEPVLSAGAHGLLIKPYGAPALAEALRTALGQSPQKTATGKPFNMTVLLLNSDPQALRETAERLKPVCRVKVATHSDRALALCQADEPPDLLLIDCDAPGIDGLALCRRLQLQSRSESIAAVVVSANNDAAWRQQAYEAGAFDCLTKPLEPKQLLQRVQSFGRFLSKQHDHRHQADTQAQQALGDEELNRRLEADLRTPLAAALALLEPLLQDEALSQDQQGSARAVEVQLLEALDSLHMSSELLRIEQGRFSLKTRGVPLRKLAERAARLAAENHAHKELKLQLKIPGPLRGAGALLASGDPLLFHTLFYGLLRIACEAAPVASTVSVNVEAAGAEGYVLRIGFAAAVPKHQQPRFFAKAGDNSAYAARRFAQAQRGDVKLVVDEAAQCSELRLELLRSQLTMAAG
jgi:two-component system sensor histidine kinase/response regulator